MTQIIVTATSINDTISLTSINQSIKQSMAHFQNITKCQQKKKQKNVKSPSHYKMFGRTERPKRSAFTTAVNKIPAQQVCSVQCRHAVNPMVKKVKFSHTRYRALGPELIPVYRQSARR